MSLGLEQIHLEKVGFMNSNSVALAIALSILPVSVWSSDVNCRGLSKAQCRMVTLVGTCALGGTGYIVEEGRVTINGKLVGHVNDEGEVVNEDGKEITELTKIYKNSCEH